MKGDFRIDIIILSLIVSAIFHGVLMYFARPLVIAHIAPASIDRASHGAMQVRAEPKRLESIALEAIPDVRPERAAPLPEDDRDRGFTASLPDAERIVTEVFAPPQVEVDLPPPPVVSPKMPELEVLVSERPSPSVERMVSDVSVPCVELIGSAEPMPIEAAFTPPQIARPVVPSSPQIASLIAPSPQGDASSAFVPRQEVMETVDPVFVEREKAAVRDLVDVSSAEDLARFVDVRLVRAAPSEGRVLFRVTVTPKAVLRTIPKDLVVLVDASGSIGRARMESIREAAKGILRSASNTGDRFNLVSFRDRYSYAFRVWQECTAGSFAAAESWLDDVASFGRTDVFATISSVLTLPRDPKRPLIALVITDGDANAGVSETSEILSRFTALNDGLVSVYMYGVRSSANRPLIDSLTHGNRGESFIFGGSKSRAGEGLEHLSERFRDPVLSDLRVVFSVRCRAEAYPRLLRNLYRDQFVEIVGSVPVGTDEIAFSLKGLGGAKAYEGYFRLPLAAAPLETGLPAAFESERLIDSRIR